jgi:hypothetical protein
MKKATGFEYRHQTALHVLLVGLALTTYLIYPDDIVWALVRRHANNRLLERAAFGVGAIVVIGSAALETWATAYDRVPPGKTVFRPGGPYRYVPDPLRLARLLFALALGLLLPLPGTVLLIAGEVILVIRLVWRDRESAAAHGSGQHRSTTPDLGNAVASLPEHAETERSWRTGLRVSASKWGVAASLILLCVTLQDRTAEITAGVGFLAWLTMNAHRSPASGTQR